MNTFSVETKLLPDDARVVAVAGELDLYTAPQFEEQILDALDNGTARIVVDLSGCEFLDSTALGILVKVRKRLGDQERRLVLVATDHNIVKVFQITGLDRVFTIVPTRASALNGAVPDWPDEEARMRDLFREANEQVRKLHLTFGQNGHKESFVCECGTESCRQTIAVQIAEYEAVRAHPGRFLIAPEHENPETERVVDANGQFAVVETFVGAASPGH